jgi:hypothetical protein
MGREGETAEGSRIGNFKREGGFWPEARNIIRTDDICPFCKLLDRTFGVQEKLINLDSHSVLCELAGYKPSIEQSFSTHKFILAPLNLK